MAVSFQEFAKTYKPEQKPKSSFSEFAASYKPKEKEESSIIGNVLAGTREGFLEDTAVQQAATLAQSTDAGSEALNTLERYGIDKSVWDRMTFGERSVMLSELSRDKTRKDNARGVDTESTSYKFGRFVGSLVDPTTLIPLGGASKLAAAKQLALAGEKEAAKKLAVKGLSTMAATGSGIGAADAALWTQAQEGAVRPGAVALGATVGAALPPALYGAGKVVGKAAEKAGSIGQKKKEAHNLFRAINDQKATFRAQGLSEEESLIESLKVLNVDGNELNKSLSKYKGEIKTYATPEEAAQAEAIARKGMYSGKAKLEGVLGSAKYALTPADTRLMEIAPPVYGDIMRVERLSKEKLHKLNEAVRPYLKLTAKLKDKELAEFRSLALSRGLKQETYEFLRAKFGTSGVAAYDKYNKAMKDLLDLENSVRGPKAQVKGEEGYHPRFAKSPQELLDYIATKYDKKAIDEVDRLLHSLAKKKKLLGADELTDHEKGKLISEYMFGISGNPKYNPTVGHTKGRKIKNVDEELQGLYSDLEQAIHTRIRNGIDDWAQRTVIGKDRMVKAGEVKETGIDLWLGDLMANKQLTRSDVDEVKKLLISRYKNAITAPGKTYRRFKALQHTTLLGQFPSVITQFEELARTAWRFGVADTAKAAFSKHAKYISPREQGFIDNLAEEYVSNGVSKKVTDWTFKKTGFQAADLFTKGVHENAALINAGKNSHTTKGVMELQKKYLPILGGKRFNALVEDLRKFDKARVKGEKPAVTSDMENYAFMELANMQPITAWGMPQAHMDNPRARVLYLLRSFTIKNIDLWRQQIVYNINNKDYRAAMGKTIALASFLTAGGMAKEQVVNLLYAKDTNLEESFWTNLLRSTGVVDRYAMKAMERQDVGAVLWGDVAPPLGVVGEGLDLAKDVTFGNTNEDGGYDTAFTQYVPFVGRILHNWMKEEKEYEEE